VTRAKKIERDIEQAARSRGARAAILIGDNIRNALDLLDEQPAVVIEALIERAKLLDQSGNVPKHRHRFRIAMIEYLEQQLQEAVARERRLARAITGAAHLPGD